MRNRFLFSILALCIGFYAFAVDFNSPESIRLAQSSADYRVTPGDVYTLTYTASAALVVLEILVDTSYRIRVSNLGVVNGTGKTFAQVKSEIEALVIRNFPLSGAQLVLAQPGVFRVFINGEVNRAGEVSAWGLSRLSSLTGSLTNFASTRDITIRSSGGQEQIYDLFRALRFGDMGQDPYLRPGDVITFNRVDRRVTINGEVRRPGTYELLRNENLRDLIELYGDGFTHQADPSRIELVRLVNSNNIAGDRTFLTENNIEGNYQLEHFDTVTVPSISQLQPVLFVEGAVDLDSLPGTVATSNRLAVRFFTGETYASLARRNVNWFSQVSDTENAYIIRNNEHIPINLNLALFDHTYRGEEFVHDNDILVIPFRQYFVVVAGAVRAPGRFPYIPNRDWEYYISLAGGFIPGQNSRNSITMFDLDGNRLRKADTITPETTIVANTNHFLFYFNQYAPVITTVLSIVMTSLTLYFTLNR